jgi:hypothetical protein
VGQQLRHHHAACSQPGGSSASARPMLCRLAMFIYYAAQNRVIINSWNGLFPQIFYLYFFH